MLQVRDLAKYYPTSAGRRLIFGGLSFELGRRDRLAVMGRNGQGKSTLIKILGGVTPATSGRVSWAMSNSWPLGFNGVFQGGMTGLDNIRFIARIYQRPIAPMIERVEAFAQLGKQLADRVQFYSSGMRARLAFGLSLAVEFDCYLIDEVIAVGDAVFRERCEQELFVTRGERAFVIASHELPFLVDHCNKALVIEGGVVRVFDDVPEAVEIYRGICDRGLQLDPTAGAQLPEPVAEPARVAASQALHDQLST
jgi:capsular polysaccharide transport system ATP-binding protein